MEAIDIQIRQSRARLAWALILAAFGIFCTLAVALPLGIREIVQTMTVQRPATLGPIIRGTALILNARFGQEVSAVDGLRLAEGDRLRTTEGSQVLVSFSDGSNVRLWPNTQVSFTKLRQTRFNDNQTEIALRLDQGHTRFEIALPNTESREFVVEIPNVDASVLLRDGSYSIFVEGQHAEVVVREGSASVVSGTHSTELLRRERLTLVSGQQPVQQEATRNLVQNGDFRDQLTGWQQGSRDIEDGVPGSIGVREEDGRMLAQLARVGSVRHGEVFLHQPLQRDVLDFESLQLSVEFKIHEQTLAGGGWLGTEYPLLIRLRYRDSNGAEATWQRGFFIQNTENHPTTYGNLVPRDIWSRVQVNLFDQSQVNPRPAELLWLEIAAAGWEYESSITNVQILAE